MTKKPPLAICLTENLSSHLSINRQRKTHEHLANVIFATFNDMAGRKIFIFL